MKRKIGECCTEERQERIRQVLRLRQKDLTLVVSNVHDPHNVSAILRSCDAFAVPDVHLYYTTQAFPVIGKRSSASARKWVTRHRHTDAADLVGQLRGQGMQILGTGFSESAKPLMDWDLTRPTAIIFGNEHSGLPPELKSQVPDEIYIPMQGMVQSLNVSVAAAIILYEAFRQRRAAGNFASPTYSEEELDRFFLEWREK